MGSLGSVGVRGTRGGGGEGWRLGSEGRVTGPALGFYAAQLVSSKLTHLVFYPSSLLTLVYQKASPRPPLCTRVLLPSSPSITPTVAGPCCRNAISTIHSSLWRGFAEKTAPWARGVGGTRRRKSCTPGKLVLWARGSAACLRLVPELRSPLSRDVKVAYSPRRLVDASEGALLQVATWRSDKRRREPCCSCASSCECHQRPD